MTRDEIIRMVKEIAGSDFENATVDEKMLDELMPLCMAVAAAMRERCAQLCESYGMPDGTSETARVLAAAIRGMK